MARRGEWLADPQGWVELFVAANFAGLIGDIYLAHSTNDFRQSSEYIPLYFSAAAAVTLAIGLAFRLRRVDAPLWRWIGYVVGWTAIAVGIAGVVLHLDSRFFYERTIKSLTYAAPFAAPLAYTGLGLLLLLDRMVRAHTIEWAQWILLLALGGFAGNFIFSLTDHAMNGFYVAEEWIPVVSAAFAVGFLVVPLVAPVTRGYLALCAGVLFVQILVGVAGFALHARADLAYPGTLLQRVTAGAPPMAPLLFPNLALLGLIGVVALDGAPRRR
jgi:hypothetical protein